MPREIDAGGNALPIAPLHEGLVKRGLRTLFKVGALGGLAVGVNNGMEANSLYDELFNDTPEKAVSILDTSGLSDIDRELGNLKKLGSDVVVNDPAPFFAQLGLYEAEHGINPILDFQDKAIALAEDKFESADELSRTGFFALGGAVVGALSTVGLILTRKRRPTGEKVRFREFYEYLRPPGWRKSLRYLGALTVAGSAYVNPVGAQAAEHVDQLASDATADLRRRDPTGQGEKFSNWLIERTVSQTSERVVDEIPHVARALNIDSAALQSIIYYQMASGGNVDSLPISASIAPGATSGGGSGPRVAALEMSFKSPGDRLKTPASVAGGATGLGMIASTLRRKTAKTS